MNETKIRIFEALDWPSCVGGWQGRNDGGLINYRFLDVDTFVQCLIYSIIVFSFMWTSGLSDRLLYSSKLQTFC